MRKLNQKITGNIIKFNSSIEVNSFYDNAKRYIDALKQGRLIYIVKHVSKSGMSRDIYIAELVKARHDGFRVMTFHALLKDLGYTFKDDCIHVKGCGMDMLFATNYDIIQTLYALRLINKVECDILSQKRLNVI